MKNISVHPLGWKIPTKKKTHSKKPFPFSLDFLLNRCGTLLGFKVGFFIYYSLSSAAPKKRRISIYFVGELTV